MPFSDLVVSLFPSLAVRSALSLEAAEESISTPGFSRLMDLPLFVCQRGERREGGKSQYLR